MPPGKSSSARLLATLTSSPRSTWSLPNLHPGMSVGSFIHASFSVKRPFAPDGSCHVRRQQGYSFPKQAVTLGVDWSRLIPLTNTESRRCRKRGCCGKKRTRPHPPNWGLEKYCIIPKAFIFIHAISSRFPVTCHVEHGKHFPCIPLTLVRRQCSADGN
jgi:hypothetical protein